MCKRHVIELCEILAILLRNTRRSIAMAFNVLIRANALPLSITIITVVAPSPVNETNISSANINDNDFASEIC